MEASISSGSIRNPPLNINGILSHLERAIVLCKSEKQTREKENRASMGISACKTYGSKAGRREPVTRNRASYLPWSSRNQMVGQTTTKRPQVCCTRSVAPSKTAIVPRPFSPLEASLLTWYSTDATDNAENEYRSHVAARAIVGLYHRPPTLRAGSGSVGAQSDQGKNRRCNILVNFYQYHILSNTFTKSANLNFSKRWDK